MKTSSTLWAVVCFLGLSAPACACEGTYYLIVFGAQPPIIKQARRTHSFATFVHVVPGCPVEAFTISWLPVTERVRPLALRPEPGRNYTLAETLEFCAGNGMEVAAWGPYQIQPELWEIALRQKTRLESGQVLYKAFDFGSPEGTVSNCIHAISFMVRPPGQTFPYVIVAPEDWGESGSYWVALTLRPWYVDPCRKHCWIMPLIGVNPEGFVFHDLSRNPARNPGVRLTQAALQSYLLPNRVRCGP